MRILGIDPGYGRMGIALLESPSHKVQSSSGEAILIHSECLETGAKSEFDERLGELLARLETLVKLWRPDCFALEKLFFNKNQKTAMRVSEMRGAIIALGQRLSLPLREYTPQQVKVAITGNGRATKGDVELMLARLIKLEKRARHDDEYDAIAIALTDIHSKVRR